jgi:sugar lactone lactonase YvrE
MKRERLGVAIVALFGAASAWGQSVPPTGQRPAFGAGALGRPAEYLKSCRVPPPGRGGGGGRGRGPAAPPTFDPKEYTVTGIAGVIAAGAKWTEVWRDDGNNADGLVGTKDGGVLFAQNDNNRIGKIDKNGKVTYPYTGLNIPGSVAMNAKGTLFVLNRGYSGLSGTARDYASIEELTPQKRVLANKDSDGDPLDCIGGVLNDAVADSKGGLYISMAGLYYGTPDGKVTKQDAKNGNPPLATNGIILTPDEKHVIVTNAGTLVIFDVGSDGQLSNQRKFADLDRTGLAEGQGAGGDGSCFDANGRFYISTANGVQVFEKDGKHLGNIPATRGLVSLTISGPQHKTLYAVTAANVNGDRKVWIDSIPLLAVGPKGRGK